MSKYQTYKEYKDSGVEWLGEIPRHWDLYSLKRSIDRCTNGFWGGEPEGKNDLCVLRVADFNRDNFTVNEGKLTLRSILPKEAESRLLKKGDLLIEKSGGGEKTLVGCVVLFDKDFPAITSNFVAKMTPNINMDSKYLTFAFSHLYSGRINFPSIKQTTGIQNLDSEAYLMEKFGFPSKTEQTQIANFLDHETAKIDTLIDNQKKLIALLKEKRQAVISHAVTKGLNPHVPMKDSGVEWLGDVPEGWVVTRAKFVSDVFIPQRNKPELNDMEGTPWITMEDMKLPYINIATKFVSDVAASQAGSKTLKKGAVIASCVGNFGITSINNFDVIINQQLQAFRPTKIKAEYLQYIVAISKQYFELIGTAATLVYVNQEGFQNLPILLPSSDEQNEICRKIGIEEQKFDLLIKKGNDQVELFSERRTALISAAVTGKIDVRNWQNPNDAKTELSA